MIVGRSDALVIFKKWQDEKVSLRCQGSFAKHAFGIEGRISLLTDTEIRINDSIRQQLTVRLGDKETYDYADSREVTGETARNYPSCIVVVFGEVPEREDPDTISFAEISPSRKI